MELTKLLTLISLYYMVQGSDEPSEDSNAELPPRRQRCPGCHKNNEDHFWGPPGPQCDGPPTFPAIATGDCTSGKQTGTKKKTNARSTVADPRPSDSSVTSFAATGNSPPSLSIQEQLDHLALEEQRLQHELNDRSLQRQLSEATARVEALRSQLQLPSLPASAFPSRADIAMPPTEVDPLLSVPPSGLSCGEVLHGLPSIRSSRSRAPTHDREVDILLRPIEAASTTTVGKKPLRIVDFVLSYTPVEDEQVISDIGGTVTKLVLKQKSPKTKKLLRNITPQEFSLANIRIFNQLLFTGALSTPQEVQEYLAYSIKILQLASRFEWTSVMTLDDEFRSLQCLYNLPWSYDSSHLIQLHLTPLRQTHNSQSQSTPARGTSSTPSRPSNTQGTNSAWITTASNGTQFCRNYNRPVGCTNTNCPYIHACNRNVQGRPCNFPHAGCQHNTIIQGGGSGATSN